MITVETCLPLVIGWGCYMLITLFLERLCSCYFPFLLSSKYYITVKNSWLCGVLISPRRTRSKESETAVEDSNKLPLCGCVYCIVAVPWLCCELIILLGVLFLAIFESDFLYSPFMTNMITVCEFLYVNKYYWLFIAGMPILYMLDYSIGLHCHFK